MDDKQRHQIATGTGLGLGLVSIFLPFVFPKMNSDIAKTGLLLGALIFLWGMWPLFRSLDWIPGFQKRMMPLKDAATLLYEEARKANSIWAYAAERMGSLGAESQSSENEILNYMATHIAGKAQIYGCRPPSRVEEPVDRADNGNGSFKNNASEFWVHSSKSPTYTNLKVRRTELKAIIKSVRE